MSDLTVEDRPSGWAARFAGDGYDAFPVNSHSLAFEASRVVKAGAGTLYGFSGFSNDTGSGFILGFDAAAVPSNGAVPVLVVATSAASNFSADWGQWGRAFTRGIILCYSTTAATLTLGSASVWIDAQYV